MLIWPFLWDHCCKHLLFSRLKHHFPTNSLCNPVTAFKTYLPSVLIIVTYYPRALWARADLLNTHTYSWSFHQILKRASLLERRGEQGQIRADSIYLNQWDNWSSGTRGHMGQRGFSRAPRFNTHTHLHTSFNRLQNVNNPALNEPMNPQRKADLTADVPKCHLGGGETCLEMNIKNKSDIYIYNINTSIYISLSGVFFIRHV